VGQFAAGDVVLVRVAFTDDSGSKVRPAVVLAGWLHRQHWDYLLVPISSRLPAEGSGIPISASDFTAGGLPAPSFVRPYYLFTKLESNIGPEQGKLARDKTNEILEAAKSLLVGTGGPFPL
jgi:hypothetical protein